MEKEEKKKTFIQKVIDFFKKFWKVIFIPIGLVLIKVISSGNESKKEIREKEKEIKKEIKEVKKQEKVVEEKKEELTSDLEQSKETLKEVEKEQIKRNADIKEFLPDL